MQRDAAHQDLSRSVPAAAAAGIIAIVPMSAVMLAADALGRMGTQPPRRIVDEAAERTPGPGPSEPARDLVATLLHVALGALLALGVLPVLALVRRLLPAVPARGAVAGALLGGAVYTSNYAGLAPALGILPPPTRDRPGRQVTMAIAHLVYGVAVGVLVNPLARIGERNE
jgi:hypothetical protein